MIDSGDSTAGGMNGARTSGPVNGTDHPPSAPMNGAPETPARNGGAPPHNKNAESKRPHRRGLRSQTLPADAGHIEREAAGLRSELEDKLRSMLPDHAVEIPTVQLALLQSCIRHEQLCQLAFKRLRDLAATAPTSEHVALWTVISRETDARDRCIKSMGLEVAPAEPDFASQLNAARLRHLTVPASPPGDAATDASETTPNDSGGPPDAS